jgi:hypothetical protein
MQWRQDRSGPWLGHSRATINILREEIIYERGYIPSLHSERGMRRQWSDGQPPQRILAQFRPGAAAGGNHAVLRIIGIGRHLRVA